MLLLFHSNVPAWAAQQQPRLAGLWPELLRIPGCCATRALHDPSCRAARVLRGPRHCMAPAAARPKVLRGPWCCVAPGVARALVLRGSRWTAAPGVAWLQVFQPLLTVDLTSCEGCPHDHADRASRPQHHAAPCTWCVLAVDRARCAAGAPRSMSNARRRRFRRGVPGSEDFFRRPCRHIIACLCLSLCRALPGAADIGGAALRPAPVLAGGRRHVRRRAGRTPPGRSDVPRRQVLEVEHPPRAPRRRRLLQWRRRRRHLLPRWRMLRRHRHDRRVCDETKRTLARILTAGPSICSAGRGRPIAARPQPRPSSGDALQLHAAADADASHARKCAALRDANTGPNAACRSAYCRRPPHADVVQLMLNGRRHARLSAVAAPTAAPCRCGCAGDGREGGDAGCGGGAARRRCRHLRHLPWCGLCFESRRGRLKRSSGAWQQAREGGRRHVRRWARGCRRAAGSGAVLTLDG
eukprot:362911-Chlamydomonas_euryale.AAC.1